MAKQYKIIKATYEKLVGVIFECAILNTMKAPKWFQDFVEKQFKPLSKEVAEIKTRLDKLEHNVDLVFDILKRNNLS